MAGEFDDLIPGRTAPTAGGGAFDDLVPTGPTPEQQRSERLRKIARASMPQDPGYGTIFGDAFTLGLQKPVAGLAHGLGNLFTGQSGFGEGYSSGVEAYQQMLDEAQEKTGWGGTATGLAGSVFAGAPRAVAQQGLWPVVKGAMQLGGIEGAARGSESLGGAIGGGLKGAGTAGATAGAIGGSAELLPSFRARRAAARTAAQGTPPDVLKDQARGLYRQLDNAGVAYDNNQSVGFVDDLISDLRQNGWSPRGVHSSLNGVIEQLEELRGQPMSLERLQQIREQVGSEAGAIEPQVRRIAGRVLRHLDGFVSTVDPAVSTLPRQQIAPMWQEARRLWRSANTAEDIGWQVGKAERRAASTNSGQNTENAIRQNIRSMMDKAERPGRYNPYNAAETAQMGRIVEGSPVQNATRRIGNAVSGIPGQTMMGLTGAGLTGIGLGGGLDAGTTALAGTAGLAASAGTQYAGGLIKDQAARMAQNEADTLMRLVTTGSTAPLPPVSGPPTREALARLMRYQATLRGAGVGAASAVTGGM